MYKKSSSQSYISLESCTPTEFLIASGYRYAVITALHLSPTCPLLLKSIFASQSTFNPAMNTPIVLELTSEEGLLYQMSIRKL